MQHPKTILTLALMLLGVFVAPSFSGAAEAVTVNNFIRAESDKYFNAYVDQGGFGKFHHIRKPIPIDKQDVIRMNRDTLYSMGIFDLTNPVTITNPPTGDRFQSMQVINQDHYTKMVEYKPGKYTLTRQKIGTRYVTVLFRTLVDASKPEDIKVVNELQDKITANQASPGKFEIPNWDKRSQDTLRDALLVLASTVPSAAGMFGDVKEVDPILHLIGTAYGWGGNPDKDATYINVVPERNDGTTPYTLTVKDVPVDGFWSISVYNAEGFYEKNAFDAYVINNLSASKNNDKSVTIHFGGDSNQPNYLPIIKGWNYVVRLYRPHKEILDGTYIFPAAKLGK